MRKQAPRHRYAGSARQGLLPACNPQASQMLEKRVLNNNHNVPGGKPDVLGKLDTSGRARSESPSTSGCCIDRCVEWVTEERPWRAQSWCYKGGDGRMELGNISQAATGHYPSVGLCSKPSPELWWPRSEGPTLGPRTRAARFPNPRPYFVRASHPCWA